MTSANSEAIPGKPVGQLWVELCEEDRSKICETISRHKKTDVLEQFSLLVEFTHVLRHPQQPASPLRADEARRSLTAQSTGSQLCAGEVAERTNIEHVTNRSAKQASNQPGALSTLPLSTTRAQTSSPMTDQKPGKQVPFGDPPHSTGQGPASSFTIDPDLFRHMSLGQENRSNSTSPFPEIGLDTASTGSPVRVPPEPSTRRPESSRKSGLDLPLPPFSTAGPLALAAPTSNTMQMFSPATSSGGSIISIASPCRMVSAIQLTAESEVLSSTNDQPSIPKPKIIAAKQSDSTSGVLPAQSNSSTTNASNAKFSLFGGGARSSSKSFLSTFGYLTGEYLLPEDHPGTDIKPFTPTVLIPYANCPSHKESFQSILFQEPYRGFSAEELRMADYQRGHRFGPVW